MNYKRLIHHKAANDIEKIVRHYAGVKKKLAKEFNSKLRSNYTRLSDNPRICQVKYGDVVRLSHLEKFHYSIHYIIDEDNKQIVVLAVFSMKEDPEKWEKRFTEIQSELGS